MKKRLLIIVSILLIPLLTLLYIAYKWYSSMSYTINKFEAKTDNNGLFFNIGINLLSTRSTPINLKGFKVQVFSGDQMVAESLPKDLRLTNNITYNIEKLRPKISNTNSLGVSIYLKFKFKLIGIPFTIKKMI